MLIIKLSWNRLYGLYIFMWCPSNKKLTHQLCPKDDFTWCKYNIAQKKKEVYDHTTRFHLPSIIMNELSAFIGGESIKLKRPCRIWNENLTSKNSCKKKIKGPIWWKWRSRQPILQYRTLLKVKIRTKISLQLGRRLCLVCLPFPKVYFFLLRFHILYLKSHWRYFHNIFFTS